ncbi:MAG: hypothetical protein J6W29_01065 [Neisseriaceae bacterium]|nr:hypothetical protein [Neisseriaceae bacterium]MBO7555283.1 hypothetical protein [Neisseriaceae bacterium]MBP5788810.1 hypothetical protein [Neisseriaceae bacterium]
MKKLKSWNRRKNHSVRFSSQGDYYALTSLMLVMTAIFLYGVFLCTRSATPARAVLSGCLKNKSGK